MNKSTELSEELNNNKAILRCAEEFGLVGDPTRMKICWLLCKHPELPVGEIARVLNVSISVVSHSLKRLRQNKLVETRRNYKQVFYRLADAKFICLLKEALAKA